MNKFTGLSDHIEKTIVSIKKAIEKTEEEILFDYDLTLSRENKLKQDIETKRYQLRAYENQLKSL